MAQAGRRPRLTPEEDKEIGELYSSGETLESILNTYDIGEGSLYRSLSRSGIPTRRGKNSKRKKVFVNTKTVTIDPKEPVVNAEDLGLVQTVELPEQEVRSTLNNLAVVVDKHDMVQEVRREPTLRSTPPSVWEIKYTGVLLIEADNIQGAIAEAIRIPAVRRVYGARLK